jgi:catalase
MRIQADFLRDGGPSVLFDAVALLVSPEGAAALLDRPVARDFVADAFAHCKFVAYTPAAQPLLEKAGAQRDAGFLPLTSAADARAFVLACRSLRFWERELAH